MNETCHELLLALQHGDSFFPGGGVSFSWGLEALHRDGQLARQDDVARFLSGQLRCRWAMLDRPVLIAALGRADDSTQLADLDKLVEALALTREFREASRRLGGALLDVHEKLGTRGAADYRRRVRSGEAPGHLAVAQGVVWGALGLSASYAAAVSAHTLCTGILGAAIRLGLIGHIDTQRCLTGVKQEIAGILSNPPPALDEIGAFAPHLDVASMRHENQSVRLFAN